MNSHIILTIYFTALEHCSTAMGAWFNFNPFTAAGHQQPR